MAGARDPNKPKELYIEYIGILVRLMHSDKPFIVNRSRANGKGYIQNEIKKQLDQQKARDKPS